MISYAYFTYNIIKSRGKKFVEESFWSIAGQSDDIMVIDYDSDDEIKKIAEKYGFRFFTIDKTPKKYFHITKMTNKAIYEAKNEYFIRLTPDVIYPENMTEFLTRKLNSINKNECLILRIAKGNSFKSPCTVFKKSGLLITRGSDERISFYGGEHKYLRSVYLNKFDLKPINIFEPLLLVHRPHKRYGININEEKYVKERNWTDMRIKALKENFEVEVKNVVNSYF